MLKGSHRYLQDEGGDTLAKLIDSISKGIVDHNFVNLMKSRLLQNVVKSEEDREEWAQAKIVCRRNCVIDKLAVPASIACGRAQGKQVFVWTHPTRKRNGGSNGMPGKLSNAEKTFLSQFDFKSSNLGHHQMVFYEGCSYETHSENKFRFVGW
jgi:hypothetical protein